MDQYTTTNRRYGCPTHLRTHEEQGADEQPFAQRTRDGNEFTGDLEQRRQNRRSDEGENESRYANLRLDMITLAPIANGISQSVRPSLTVVATSSARSP